MTYKNKTSVTIITGFLGAGKTTFINFLLKKYSEIRFALVENEFGEVAIDTKLIKGVDASQMFELKEGCICCTISDEYELVLQELAERFPEVQYLLIEPTGVADPTSVIRPFFRDANLQETYHFNGTVCIVDALNFKNEIQKDLKQKQIAVADFVLISKSDKLTYAEREDLAKYIGLINPFCKIQLTDFESISQFELENINFQPKIFPDFPKRKINHSNITSKKITYLKPVDKDKFVHWLSYTLDVYKNEIYRVKGIICFEHEAYKYVIQGVAGNFEVKESEHMLSPGKTEIAFIGMLHNIDLTF